MNVRKVLSILTGLVLLSAFAGTLYYLYSKSEEPPVVHKVESPARTTIVDKTVATGSVVPRKEVAIKPQVSGIIERLEVQPGDSVRTGDVIARVRIIPDMVTLNEAETRVARAQLALDDADWQLERHERLSRDGAISESELKATRLEHERAEQEVAAARDNLDLIRKGSTSRSGDASNTLVRSTSSGMVLEVPVEEGDSVIEANTFNEGTTLATVADMDELIFLGKVDESEVGKIRPGMELVLTIGAIEGQRFGAVLEHIAPKGVAEEGAIQFEIRAAIDPAGAGAAIRANLSANADIVLGRREDVLAVPEGLLQFEEGKPYVEVETAPQVFEKRFIETGLSDGIHIEIVSGVTADDRIRVPA